MDPDEFLEMQYEERVSPAVDSPTPDYDAISFCIICGDPIDYCWGHGESGNILLQAHDSEDHTHCHPNGCEEAFNALQ